MGQTNATKTRRRASSWGFGLLAATVAGFGCLLWLGFQKGWWTVPEPVPRPLLPTGTLNVVQSLSSNALTDSVKTNRAPVPPGADPRAVELLNGFMNGLLIEDEVQRLRAVIPLIHKSLLTPDGKSFRQSVRDNNYLTAVRNVRSHAVPVTITRVDPVMSTESSRLALGEAGSVYRYHVAKREGVTGQPAIIQVFFPVGGGPPSIVQFGLL